MSKNTPFQRNKTYQQHNRPFRRRCEACKQHGHHANKYWFLQKIRSCLELLSKDGTLPSQLHASATASGHYDSYNKRSNVVRTLIDNNFILYNQVDPDIFINVVTDNTYFIPDDASQNEDIQSE